MIHRRLRRRGYRRQRVERVHLRLRRHRPDNRRVAIPSEKPAGSRSADSFAAEAANNHEANPASRAGYRVLWKVHESLAFLRPTAA
jgi:hypothetical protein